MTARVTVHNTAPTH